MLSGRGYVTDADVALTLLLYSNNSMKSQGFLIIVHLHIAMVFRYCFPNALYSKTMFVFIGFCGVQYAALFIKRIFSAGINNGYHNKRCSFMSAGTDFNKRIRNIFSGFYGIVQQIAKKRSNICICDKINDSASNICVKSNMFIKAVLPVPCKYCI